LERHRYGCVGSDRDRKTAAFGFPVIQKIDANNRNTQALILSPTRELCLQITNEIKTTEIRKGINVVAIYGGASITDQAREIKRGAQIIVATQEECKMINRGLVNISQIDFVF
jgi:ATP-dependent RNA helicase DeaD